MIRLATTLPTFQLRGDGETMEAEIDLIAYPFNLNFAGRTPSEVNAWMELADSVEPKAKSASGTLVGSYTTSTSDNRITCASHSLANDDVVILDGTLPTPLVADTRYFVVGARGNDFQTAENLGGAVIDLTSQGSGQIWKQDPLLPEVPVLEQLIAYVRGSIVFLQFTNAIPVGKVATITLTLFTDLTAVSATPPYQKPK